MAAHRRARWASISSGGREQGERELVGAEVAEQRAVGPVLDALAHQAQDAVARLAPEQVVHLAKADQVDHADGDQRTLFFQQQALQVVQEHRAVEHAGDRIAVAQFEQVGRDASQQPQLGGLGDVERARAGAHHPQVAQQVLALAAQGNGGVVATIRRPGHQRVGAEARIAAGIEHLEPIRARADRAVAERSFARKEAVLDADVRRQPDARLEHQADAADVGAAGLHGQPRDVVELGVGRFGQHVAVLAAQRMQARLRRDVLHLQARPAPHQAINHSCPAHAAHVLSPLASVGIDALRPHAHRRLVRKT